MPGAKPMPAAERARCFVPSSIFGQVVPRGYPLLRRHGAAIRNPSLHLADLSYAFKDYTDQLYQDECCHFLPGKYGLLARAIVDRIR